MQNSLVPAPPERDTKVFLIFDERPVHQHVDVLQDILHRFIGQDLLESIPRPDPLVLVREPPAYLLRERYDLLPVVGQPRKRLSAEERHTLAPLVLQLVKYLLFRLVVKRPAVLLVLRLGVKASRALPRAAADEQRNAETAAVRYICARYRYIIHVQASSPLCLTRCSTSSCLPILKAVL